MEQSRLYGTIKFLQGLNFWRAFLLHTLVATVGSFAIGFFPEVGVGGFYHDTRLEPYSPAIFAVAIFLGFVINIKIGQKAALLAWVIPATWLVCGMYDESKYWYNDPTAVSRWQYISDNFFGPTVKCSGSECLAELFYTTPCAASIAYSIGSALGYVVYRRKEKGLDAVVGNL
jgi:hypothetical protein